MMYEHIYAAPNRADLVDSKGDKGKYFFWDKTGKLENDVLVGNAQKNYRQIEASPAFRLVQEGRAGVYIAQAKYSDTINGMLMAGKTSNHHKDAKVEELRQLFLDDNPRFTTPGNSRIDGFTEIFCGGMAVLDILHLDYFLWRHNLSMAEKSCQEFLYQMLDGVYGKLLHCRMSGYNYNPDNPNSEFDGGNPGVLVAVIFEFGLYLEYPRLKLNQFSDDRSFLAEIVDGKRKADPGKKSLKRSTAFVGSQGLKDIFLFFNEWTPQKMGQEREEYEAALAEKVKEGWRIMRERKATGMPLCFSFALARIVLMNLGVSKGSEALNIPVWKCEQILSVDLRQVSRTWTARTWTARMGAGT